MGTSFPHLLNVFVCSENVIKFSFLALQCVEIKTGGTKDKFKSWKTAEFAELLKFKQFIWCTVSEQFLIDFLYFPFW